MSSSKDKTSLVITEKTIKYSGQVYQLSNITQVAKYKVSKGRWATAILAVFIGAGGMAIAAQRGGEAAGVGVIGFAVLLLLWALLRRRMYVLRLETSSGSAELFASKNQHFIDELILTISEVMESQVEGTNIIAYTDKSKIINNTSHKVVKGDEVAGDKFNNIKNSQVVTHSPGSNISMTIGDRYGEEVASAFMELARHIEQRNDAGSAALLDKLKEEISNPKPDKSRVESLWNTLVRILPDAAKVAGSIAAIATAIL